MNVTKSLRMLDTNLPACLVEHVNLVAWAVRVGYQQAWPNDVEGGIDVHWVGVLERENMKPVLVPQVATHPLNAKVVCHLCKDIQISFYPVNLSCSLLLSVSWQTIFREIFWKCFK